MALNIAASLCVLSLGVLIVGTGLRLLNRLDRLGMEYNKQNACRWHHWQMSEDGSTLVCGICGKKNQMVNSSHDQVSKSVPFDHHFL